jgi:NAD(P)-dependent dehydrogenase (short-subunit alcohol dehydrogenase family)
MVREMFDLGGLCAFVTGAARGIGKGYARALAELGASVAVADVNESGARETAEEIRKDFGVETLALGLDVTDSKAVREAVLAVVKTFGSLDIGVNNAGVASNYGGEELTDEQWHSLMRINLDGVFYCCREEGKHMLSRGRGSIINTASMSGSIVNTPQKQAHYNASKAAVVMLTRSLAAEWADRGVRVNCISPGYILTEMNRKPHVVPLHKTWIEKTPMGRLGEVEDLMAAVVYLASRASSFMTGHDFIIDGGYTLW